MKLYWKTAVVLALACTFVLALPAVAQRSQDGSANASYATPRISPATPNASSLTLNRLPVTNSDPERDCHAYSATGYCAVTKVKNGVCVHNFWQQTHHGQTGVDCVVCFDEVNPAQDVLLYHYETPAEGCEPYNDCQDGRIEFACQ